MKIGIIFDMDGTLLDTLEDLTDAVNVAMEQFGYPVRTADQVRRALGNGADHLIRCCVPEGTDISPVREAFQAYYSVHCRDKTAPYPGLMEVLGTLSKTYPMAVVSNKPDIAVKIMANALFPGVYGVGETKGVPIKPAPDMLLTAMEAIGVERCIYVGDSEVDLATARNAGVPCVSVLWGFRSREDLIAAGARHFCETPNALPRVIEALAQDLTFPGNP